MAEQSEDRPLGRFPDFDLGRLTRQMRTWTLRVAEAFNVTPRMRRVRFTGSGLDEVDWCPGQDLVLSLAQPGGDIAKRHYTIRDQDGGHIDIDFVLHGDSPAVAWARAARPGAAISAQGPRGRTSVRFDARDHWFVGDETALPAIFAMAESLPANAHATALIEVHDEREQQKLAAAAAVDLNWISRHGADAGPSAMALEQLKKLAPAAPGAHAYLLGETSKVRALRHYLLERGFTRDQITSEGYWRPGRIGGHDHV